MIGYPTPSEIVEWAEWAKLPRVDRETLRVGDLVTISSRGSNRRVARVTKIGRERIQTEYTTPSALVAAAKCGTTPNVTRKPVRLDDAHLRFYAKREQRVLPGRPR